MTILEYFDSFDRFGAVPILAYCGLNARDLTTEQCLLNPKLHAEVVTMSLRQFEPDAVLPLLDLTVEAESYGAQVHFSGKKAPEIEKYLTIEKATSREGQNGYRMDTMLETARLISKQVSDVPKGFFVTGPLTLAGQIIGVDRLLMELLHATPAVTTLIDDCTETVVGYAKRLEEAGIDFVVMAEPTSSLIAPKQFNMFARSAIGRVVNSISKDIILHICGRAGHLLTHMIETGVAAVSLDQNVALSDAVKQVPSRVLVFGNYSPSNLVTETPETVSTNVSRMLSPVREARNVVACTGCDLPASTPPENIKAFIRAAKLQNKTRA